MKRRKSNSLSDWDGGVCLSPTAFPLPEQFPSLSPADDAFRQFRFSLATLSKSSRYSIRVFELSARGLGLERV